VDGESARLFWLLNSMMVSTSFVDCFFVGSVFLQAVMLARARDRTMPARAFLIMGEIEMRRDGVFKFIRESFCVGRMIV